MENFRNHLHVIISQMNIFPEDLILKFCPDKIVRKYCKRFLITSKHHSKFLPERVCSARLLITRIFWKDVLKDRMCMQVITSHQILALLLCIWKHFFLQIIFRWSLPVWKNHETKFCRNPVLWCFQDTNTQCGKALHWQETLHIKRTRESSRQEDVEMRKGRIYIDIFSIFIFCQIPFAGKQIKDGS